MIDLSTIGQPIDNMANALWYSSVVIAVAMVVSAAIRGMVK
jgi:hypothetical protein